MLKDVVMVLTVFQTFFLSNIILESLPVLVLQQLFFIGVNETNQSCFSYYVITLLLLKQV